jgi:hypothetical protein
MLDVTWRHPPLWIRWALTLVVFAGLGIGVVAVYRGATRLDTGSGAPEPSVEGQAAVARDQAPQSRPLARAAAPRVALERAIAGDMRSRIRRNEVSRPLERSGCTPAGDRRGSRRAFRCKARTGGLVYPFLGVVDLRARRVTWCKRDPPPSPALDVPVSRRCRG